MSSGVLVTLTILLLNFYLMTLIISDKNGGIAHPLDIQSTNSSVTANHSTSTTIENFHPATLSPASSIAPTATATATTMTMTFDQPTFKEDNPVKFLDGENAIWKIDYVKYYTGMCS